MHRRLLYLLPALALLRPWPAAAELRVLSAGAVEPGIVAALRGFAAAGGEPAQVTYATAPRLQARVAAGETPDLLIAPVALFAAWAAEGKVTARPVPLGRVGIGVVVRPRGPGGAPEPVITDAATLRAAMQRAEAVVFNRASTGQAMERLFERLGLTAIVTPKARRHATGAEVLEDVLRSPEAAIGFAARTEIGLVPALRDLGPLPEALQNYTSYAAAVPPGGRGEALLRHLASPEGRAALDAAGVTAAP
jgi:molybdate transport system substrate-binding protein